MEGLAGVDCNVVRNNSRGDAIVLMMVRAATPDRSGVKNEVGMIVGNVLLSKWSYVTM
jgi:hypothetical protein